MAYIKNVKPTRMDVYPNGIKIPANLPDDYQPAAYGAAPPGEWCLTCKHYALDIRYCSKWQAPARPRWWCSSWTE